jgi:glutamate dehydrogenase
MGNTSPAIQAIDSHAQLSDQLIKFSKKQRNKTTGSMGFVRLIEQYYSHVSLKDLGQYPMGVLYGKVSSMWAWLYERDTDHYKVRVYRPTEPKHGWDSETTLVEIVARDMPFLVDSIHMALSKMGYTVKFTVNIGGLGVKRDKGKIQEIYSIGHVEHGSNLEAIIQMEIDHSLNDKECQALTEMLCVILADVQLAVSDWGAMLNEAKLAVDELESCGNGMLNQERSESIAFIKWMCHDNFTFLGCREYDIGRDGKTMSLCLKPESGLGVLRHGPSSQHKRDYADMPKRARDLALSANNTVLIQKTNTESTVHRPGKTDCVVVKRFDKNGALVGQRCFIGLFTSTAYHSRPKDIPILRKKVASVVNKSGFLPKSHTGKALVHILDTLPRDDLFQATVDEIDTLANGILHLQDRSVIRLFVRKDAFERYYSCLVYMPREVFNTDLLYRVQRLFADYFKTDEIVFSIHFSDSVLARIHFMVTLPMENPTSGCDVSHLEHEVMRLCRSWRADFRQALMSEIGDYTDAKVLFDRYAAAFPASYCEVFSPEQAVQDVQFIAKLGSENDIQMQFSQPTGPSSTVCFKLYRRGATAPLSDVLPMLENMGLRVIGEQPHCVTGVDSNEVWINHFDMVCMHGDVSMSEVSTHLEETFSRVWHAQAGNDAFNRLVILTGLSCGDVMVLRAYARYLRQLGFTFSQSYMVDAFLAYPRMAERLAAYFNCKFDPCGEDLAREKSLQKIERHIQQSLADVSSLDHDRIFRRYLNLMQVTLRTNFFKGMQDNGFCDYLSLKIAVRDITDMILPEPLPQFDVFVHSCRHGFEGVHLRDSKVARGGIRRSDRLEDFRTEVAGLQRAQQMKNALIVPSGAKGAFVLTDSLAGKSREDEMALVINAYQHFVRGLLDVTDNLSEAGEVISPEGVVCHDDQDHYMVVAADKGTSTFSDIANEIAKSYGYWLGDAFASGGSVGYDHKKVGITARGAWASVAHHFQQSGINVQRDPICVVGIGDMGGDVFGNGMLLSKTIALKAAFNHVHIFLDPNPDPKRSFQERQRLFRSAKCSWADYNASKLSKGGGVYDRSAKSIALTSEVKAWLGVDKDSLVPNDLIRLILMSEVDLIWNGGIGTFVRGSDETDQDAADSANNAIRVTAASLRCRAFAEGGNLGLTQRARIEFALAGGEINTDFIDNSAGVDCSDHEVNIKILLNHAMRDGKLSGQQRNDLLSTMSDEVAELVLASNVKQNCSISLAVSESLKYLNLYQRYMTEQEEMGALTREVFDLPSDKVLMDRKSQGIGLTRPEVAVLMAHTKNQLKSYIVASELLDDPYLACYIELAFPRLLRTKYRSYMDQHKLSREIIATQLSNNVVNDMGGNFIHQMQDETGADIGECLVAYVIAKEVYQMDQLMMEITSLDYKVSAALQAVMMQDVIRLVRRSARWFLRNRDRYTDIGEVIVQFSKDVRALSQRLPGLLAMLGDGPYQSRVDDSIAAGLSPEMAEKMVSLSYQYSLLNIIESARGSGHSLVTVASVYFAVSEHLQLDWLRERINEFHVDDRWAVLARATVKADLDVSQRKLAVSVLHSGVQARAPEKKLQCWLDEHGGKVDRWLQVVQQLLNVERHDFAMLAVVSQELTTLAKVCQVSGDSEAIA